MDEILPAAKTGAPKTRVKLVHGDLKPVSHVWEMYYILTSPKLNVLIDDDGVAKICDFGLLRLVRDSAPTGMTTTSSHTGTTRYLSYELVSEDDDEDPKPTTASDVWALACIGFEVGYSALLLIISPNARSVHLLETTACKDPGFKTKCCLQDNGSHSKWLPSCNSPVKVYWCYFGALEPFRGVLEPGTIQTSRSSGCLPIFGRQ